MIGVENVFVDKELIALGWDDDYHLYSFDLSKVTFTW